MNSFIVIDGLAFWLLLIYIIVSFLFICLYANAWLKSKREIDRKDRLIKKLRSDNNYLLGECLKANFKVAGVKDDKKKQNTKVG